MNHADAPSICPHFKMSRQELFQVIKIKNYESFARRWTESAFPAPWGASYASRLWLVSCHLYTTNM